jgi:hypothetical protein
MRLNADKVTDSFYATKEERKKNAKREYENQMAQRAHLQGLRLPPSPLE